MLLYNGALKFYILFRKLRWNGISHAYAYNVRDVTFYFKFSAGHHRNPQTEAFLQFLELKYYLDNAMERRDQIPSPPMFIANGTQFIFLEVCFLLWKIDMANK